MTNSKKSKIELLAPAKTADIGIAAINFGADAVYIGAEKFSARETAGNNLFDIEKLIRHAHLFYARVYVAVNTILKDAEMADAERLINSLYEIGADAVIIQDFGLLNRNLPPIPIFASTQANNDSLEKIKFLESVGFSRVILPREMSVETIKNIRAQTHIDLETFCHGSLCVSHSGQCYLSYAFGGRSANRGACAQPCRKLYNLVNEQGKVIVQNKHLLSLKDLNLSQNISELIDAGITSFKIEGRLKDIAYVQNITAFYRKKLDAVLEGKNLARASSGKTLFNFTPSPEKTFNRGFTNFGVDGKKGFWGSINTPKSLGEKIGRIKILGNNYFILESSAEKLNNGDGICFFNTEKILCGTTVNIVGGGRVFPNNMDGLSQDALIYRNHNHLFLKQLAAKNAAERKIALAFKLSETAKGFSLKAQDEDENVAEYEMPAKKTIAQKESQAKETIRKQLSKLNDTIFYCAKIEQTFKETYFFPVSFLNELRRNVVQNLLEGRLKNYPKTRLPPKSKDAIYPAKSLSYLGNILNADAANFYKLHGVQDVEQALEAGGNIKNKQLMISKYCIKQELGLCKKNTGELFLIPEEGEPLRLKFDCDVCQMSVWTSPK